MRSPPAIADAVTAVDEATDHAPAYFIVNCAHPTHLEKAWADGEPWMKRIRGLRANASARSHAELDKATELDPGDPAEFGRQYAELRRRLPHLTVLGGCCGTDHRHLEAICRSCVGHKHEAFFPAHAA